MAENIRLSDIIPATPEAVYLAWLDADEHSRMTGAKATDEGGGRFTAADGYITGRTVSAVPHTRIVQAWRTSEFPPEEPDSVLTVLLEPFDGGTRVTLQHDNIPAEQGESYRSGWDEHYFTPMKNYFASPAAKARAVVAEARVAARKQAIKAVKTVKKAQKTAAGKLRAFGKKVKALVARKGAPKKATKKAAPKKKAKKVVTRKKKR